jgi:hypothetical protein
VKINYFWGIHSQDNKNILFDIVLINFNIINQELCDIVGKICNTASNSSLRSDYLIYISSNKIRFSFLKK